MDLLKEISLSALTHKGPEREGGENESGNMGGGGNCPMIGHNRPMQKIVRRQK